jgi:hypothetical protein
MSGAHGQQACYLCLSIPANSDRIGVVSVVAGLRGVRGLEPQAEAVRRPQVGIAARCPATATTLRP